MLRKIKALAALLLLFFSTKNAFAEAVLYCTEEFNTGFIQNKNGWKVGNFKPQRFTMKVVGDWDAIVFSEERFTCNRGMEWKGFWPIMCKDDREWSGKSFNIDKYSLRFVRADASVAGYASVMNTGEKHDTDNFAAGICEKF